MNLNRNFIKKILLYLIGNFCVITSSRTFPSPKSLTFSEWLGELVFSPFSLLGGVLLFIAGFMAFALLVKDVIIIVIKPYINQKSLSLLTGSSACFLLIAFIIQIMLHPVTGTLAVILAIAYGIMEAHEVQMYDREM